MVIEEMSSPTAFVRQRTSKDYCKTSNFFFWLIFLVSSPLSLTIMRFSHSSSINTSLGKTSKFPMSSISIPFRPSSTITAFSEWLSSSMKARVFFKIKLGKKQVKICKRGLLDFNSYIFVSFSSVEKILTKVN